MQSRDEVAPKIEVEFLYLPRDQWPAHIREFFARQKEAIDRALFLLDHSPFETDHSAED